MSDTKPLSAPPMAVLHVIAHLRWEREWFETFEMRQPRLLDHLARLLDQMGGSSESGHALRYFLLGGQTIILEDVAAVRPDLVSLIVIYNASGRLGLGPWYVQVDQSLVSGESLIRNLLASRADALKMGMKLVPIAYAHEGEVYTAHLPQILTGFGMNAALLRYDNPELTTPFRWESPDGSSILLMNHQARSMWAQHNRPDLKESLKHQQSERSFGPYLWMIDYEDVDMGPAETMNQIEIRAELPATQSDVADFIRMLRREKSDSSRLTVHGELYPRQYITLPPGTWSSRMYIKQAHARTEAFLSHTVEPWLALALTHGKIVYPDNARALLAYYWRLLMQNQTSTTLGGSSSDAVHDENEQRFRKIQDGGRKLLLSALEELPGTLHNPQPGMAAPEQIGAGDTTYVVVWNAHNWPVKQPVEVALQLPQGRHPARLRVPGSDTEQSFSWAPAERDSGISGVLSFVADAPAVGYAAYTLELSDTNPDDTRRARQSPGRTIANVLGEMLVVQHDTVTWKREDATIPDVLRFYDGGDAGDTFHYSPPLEDLILQADLLNDVQVESSPIYERLIMRHRMRVAPGLTPQRMRPRGVKLLELTTTATFYDHVPGVFFRTTFDNNAEDHRLRVHLRTGLASRTLVTHDAVGISERPANGVYAMQTVCAVDTGESALALLGRGLPEVEALQEQEQVTLALTLLRSVGWLSRDDLRVRSGALGPQIPVPGAQGLRAISAEYGLLPVAPGDPAALLRAASEYRAPVQAFQYDKRPDRPRRSFLSVVSDRADGSQSDGAGAVITAFKPPQKGKGWIVRLFNPHDTQVDLFLTPHMRPDSVQLLNLAEEPVKFLETDGNGRVNVQVDARQLLTLRLSFI